MDTETVELLVERARRGDRDALGALLSSHRPAIERLAKRYCPASDAADAVQEVLFRASEEIGALRVAKTFLSWSMTMLVRECFRFHKRAARFVALEVHESPSPPMLPPFDLLRALRELPDEPRRILLEHDILGRTVEETAEVLGIGLEATKSRLRRARGALRRSLEGDAHATRH